MSKFLYEILVPTKYGDTVKPIKTRHHKEWDKRIQRITGGLTILAPGKGKWVYKGVEYPEKVIPVRVMCSEDDIEMSIELTIQHYRQTAVMYYELSRNVHVVYAKGKEPAPEPKIYTMGG